MLITTNVLGKLQRSLRSGAKTTGLDKSVESLELSTLGYKSLEDGELSKSGLLSVMDAIERYGVFNLILPPVTPIWCRNMDAGLRYVGLFVEADEFTLIAANPSNVVYSAFKGNIANHERFFDGMYYAPISRETAVKLSSLNKLISKGGFSISIVGVARGSSVEFSLVMRNQTKSFTKGETEVNNG